MAKKEDLETTFLADSFGKKNEDVLPVEEKAADKIPSELPKESTKKVTKKEKLETKIPEIDFVFAKCPGVTTCPECGSKRLTNDNGDFVCAINKKDCTFIK
jgi:hypothetical protein